MATLNLVQAINLALKQEMQKDDRVIILGEDVGPNGGVFRVTEDLHAEFGDNRVILLMVKAGEQVVKDLQHAVAETIGDILSPISGSDTKRFPRPMSTA